MRTLVAIPVYNEEKYIRSVISRVVQHAPDDVLVIDDGSTDRTPCLLAEQHVEVIRHATNRGYGRSLQDAFRWSIVDGYDWVITMDCDEQHEPEAIAQFIEEAERDAWDIVSGSRYLKVHEGVGSPPAARRAINHTITDEINAHLGLSISDAFCGFKAYRVAALQELALTETGYAFPLQFWVQAVAAQLRITEVPVKLIYNDPTRTFGGPLNDDCVRLAHYREVLARELDRSADRLPVVSSASECASVCAESAG